MGVVSVQAVKGYVSKFSLSSCVQVSRISKNLSAVPSGDRHFWGEIHILDSLEQLYAIGTGTLKSLAARDEAHTPSTLVNHSGSDGFS